MSRRSTMSLDGRWQLALLDVPGVDHPGSVEVDVPAPWTVQVPGFERSSGTVRYSRMFEVPADWPADGHVVLRFGAVNHAADVWVNGLPAGGHVGGWTPFELSVGELLDHRRPNRLEVVVGYPPMLADEPGAGLDEVPHGKQGWYGTTAGIWQPVLLEHRPVQHVHSVRVRSDAVTGAVGADVVLAEKADEGLSVEILVREHSDGAKGVRVAQGRADVAIGTKDAKVAATIDSPALWSPDAPHLYDVVVSIHRHAEEIDSVTVRTGFRTVTTAHGQVVLNGKPVELRGVLDQDYHPGSTTRAESVEELERLLREVKRLGFNLVRCHIKRPDPTYYDLADRLGLMVWAELPSWQRFTDRSSEAGRALLREMLTLDGHHPSIVAWTVVNESWGLDLRDENQRRWVADTQQWAKDLEPGVLVVDNSPCEPHFHVRSDLDDFHVYRGIPERRGSWDEWVDELASRPSWTYSPYGDAQRSGKEPLVVSEFGNWGLPQTTDQLGPDGEEPWWFDTGADWAFGAAHPHGVVDRFDRLGLSEVFGSWTAFVEATQSQQLLADRYQIGSLRRRPEIAGYVLTQLSDVQWEANGLLDMKRRPRSFLDDLALINGPAAVVLRPKEYSAHTSEHLDIGVDVVPPRSGAARRPRQEWVVALTVEGEEQQVHRVPAGTRSALAERVRMPAAVGAARVRAELLADRRLLARDEASISVVPDTQVSLPRRVCCDDDDIRSWLEALQVPLAHAGDKAKHLLVTRRFSPDAQAHARRGGRVLVLVEDADALDGAFDIPPPVRLAPRAGDGHWVPRFDWLRRTGPFAAVPGGPLLDLAFEPVIGDLVLEGLPAPLRPARVHSAMFAGWLQHAATTSATVTWSHGAATLTTFRVRQAGPADPLAATLTYALLEQAAG
jgi:hypothetical protein